MMKILICDIVQKELTKIFSSAKAQELFLDKLKLTSPEAIYLKRPYVKIKVRLFSSSLRIIANYSKRHNILVLLFVFKKSDKTFGDNVFWNKAYEQKIIKRNENINVEIKSKSYVTH